MKEREIHRRLKANDPKPKQPREGCRHMYWACGGHESFSLREITGHYLAGGRQHTINQKFSGKTPTEVR